LHQKPQGMGGIGLPINFMLLLAPAFRLEVSTSG